MPEARVALEVSSALHALAHLLDQDKALSALATTGLSVLLAHLAAQLDELGGALMDAELQAA